MKRFLSKLTTMALCMACANPVYSDTLRDVVVVGNNWDGTATLVDPQTNTVLNKINVVPDMVERMQEIEDGGFKQKFMFWFIRTFIGQGNNQYVDDMFLSHDGRFLYASRPSFADVVALDLTTNTIAWRTKVEGGRADHAALSPDGKTFLVSASTARKVHAIDVATGAITASFESGDQPHENNYSADGQRIYHASIGKVFISSPKLDFIKGDRWFEVVDAKTMQVTKRIDMSEKIKAFGLDLPDHAIRPMAISPDEKFAYLEISLFHGILEYDLTQDKITRKIDLPIAEHVQKMGYGDYQLNSAFHGLAINPQGNKLCAAGTMSDYVALVDIPTWTHKIVATGKQPYWTTPSADGKNCYISLSEEDAMLVVSFDEGKEVARIAVGNHPQRIRTGQVLASVIQ